MEPLLTEGCRTSGEGEGKVKPPVAATAWTLSAIPEGISICCMKTAMALAGVYFVFLSYVSVAYTPSWAEKLRLSPLLILAVIVPLLGAVMI